MAAYCMRMQIADITICFETDQESDISDLGGFFKYHLTDSTDEPDCTVVLKRQASFYMPKDVEMLWQSKCHGVGEPKGRLGRQRINVSSKVDTFGFASCYYSRAHEEYYYGLMQDKSWICYKPAEHTVKYVLHHRPHKTKRALDNTSTNPLSAITLLIHVLTTVHGRFLTHGAAVCLDGKASLFLGKSGSGKSTLCTDLAKQQASFMGDDLVLLYMKDGVPMVGSLLLPAKMYVDSNEEKSSIDVPENMQTGYCLSAPLVAAYSVRQSGSSASTVEPRPSVELLQQLLEASNGMLMHYDKQQWLDTMYEICERTPYSVFHFGDRATLDIAILKSR